MARSEGEAGAPIVVACVAYAIYKNEKRDWIVRRCAQLNRRPSDEEIQYYVSTITAFRINRLLIQAREFINIFARDVLDKSKEDIADQIYKSQFQSIHDMLRAIDETSDARYDATKLHTASNTRARWWVSIGQNLQTSSGP